MVEVIAEKHPGKSEKEIKDMELKNWIAFQSCENEKTTTTLKAVFAFAGLTKKMLGKGQLCEGL